jgi:hypothetical protein
MKLELSLNNGYVYLGEKINIRSKFNFDEDSSILWSGIRLLTYPPCLKELQITKEEIFTKGLYELKLILRQPHPINPDDDLVINKTQKVQIREKQSNIPTKKPNPLSISISGLSINLSKDVFKPGETIKINFSSEELKQVEIRLLQKANLVCYCDAYGQTACYCRRFENY